MPTHVYQPSRNPPTWRDRLLVHPTDTTVVLIAILFGVLVVLVSGFLGTGGVLSMLGLNWWVIDNQGVAGAWVMAVAPGEGE